MMLLPRDEYSLTLRELVRQLKELRCKRKTHQKIPKENWLKDHFGGGKIAHGARRREIRDEFSRRQCWSSDLRNNYFLVGRNIIMGFTKRLMSMRLFFSLFAFNSRNTRRL